MRDFTEQFGTAGEQPPQSDQIPYNVTEPVIEGAITAEAGTSVTLNAAGAVSNFTGNTIVSYRWYLNEDKTPLSNITSIQPVSLPTKHHGKVDVTCYAIDSQGWESVRVRYRILITGGENLSDTVYPKGGRLDNWYETGMSTPGGGTNPGGDQGPVSTAVGRGGLGVPGMSAYAHTVTVPKEATHNAIFESNVVGAAMVVGDRATLASLDHTAVDSALKDSYDVNLPNSSFRAGVTVADDIVLGGSVGAAAYLGAFDTQTKTFTSRTLAKGDVVADLVAVSEPSETESAVALILDDGLPIFATVSPDLIVQLAQRPVLHSTVTKVKTAKKLLGNDKLAYTAHTGVDNLTVRPISLVESNLANATIKSVQSVVYTPSGQPAEQALVTTFDYEDKRWDIAGEMVHLAVNHGFVIRNIKSGDADGAFRFSDLAIIKDVVQDHGYLVVVGSTHGDVVTPIIKVIAPNNAMVTYTLPDVTMGTFASACKFSDGIIRVLGSIEHADKSGDYALEVILPPLETVFTNPDTEVTLTGSETRLTTVKSTIGIDTRVSTGNASDLFGASLGGLSLPGAVGTSTLIDGGTVIENNVDPTQIEATVARPTILSVTGGRVTSSDFVVEPADGEVHHSSDWRYSTDLEGTDVVSTTVKSADKVATAHPIGDAGDYYVAVRHNFGDGTQHSQWSPGFSFTVTGASAAEVKVVSIQATVVGDDEASIGEFVEVGLDDYLLGGTYKDTSRSAFNNGLIYNTDLSTIDLIDNPGQHTRLHGLLSLDSGDVISLYQVDGEAVLRHQSTTLTTYRNIAVDGSDVLSMSVYELVDAGDGKVHVLGDWPDLAGPMISIYDVTTRKFVRHMNQATGIGNARIGYPQRGTVRPNGKVAYALNQVHGNDTTPRTILIQDMTPAGGRDAPFQIRYLYNDVSTDSDQLLAFGTAARPDGTLGIFGRLYDTRVNKKAGYVLDSVDNASGGEGYLFPDFIPRDLHYLSDTAFVVFGNYTATSLQEAMIAIVDTAAGIQYTYKIGAGTHASTMAGLVTKALGHIVAAYNVQGPTCQSGYINFGSLESIRLTEDESEVIDGLTITRTKTSIQTSGSVSHLSLEPQYSGGMFNDLAHLTDSNGQTPSIATVSLELIAAGTDPVVADAVVTSFTNGVAYCSAFTVDPVGTETHYGTSWEARSGTVEGNIVASIPKSTQNKLSWNPGTLPAGTYVVRARHHYDSMGINESEWSAPFTVTVAATDGKDFAFTGRVINYPALETVDDLHYDAYSATPELLAVGNDTLTTGGVVLVIDPVTLVRKRSFGLPVGTAYAGRGYSVTTSPSSIYVGYAPGIKAHSEYVVVVEIDRSDMTARREWLVNVDTYGTPSLTGGPRLVYDPTYKEVRLTVPIARTSAPWTYAYMHLASISVGPEGDSQCRVWCHRLTHTRNKMSIGDLAILGDGSALVMPGPDIIDRIARVTRTGAVNEYLIREVSGSEIHQDVHAISALPGGRFALVHRASANSDVALTTWSGSRTNPVCDWSTRFGMVGKVFDCAVVTKDGVERYFVAGIKDSGQVTVASFVQDDIDPVEYRIQGTDKALTTRLIATTNDQVFVVSTDEHGVDTRFRVPTDGSHVDGTSVNYNITAQSVTLASAGGFKAVDGGAGSDTPPVSVRGPRSPGVIIRDGRTWSGPDNAIDF